MAKAYYNEIDQFAAQWLRELIKAGLIAPGEVDERSIEDVTPNDLRGFTQCHFFAGIGVWSYALRSTGWSDDKPVWTGSCPCQPFSAAGKGNGFADERHLWPAFHWLISQCRPHTVFGEQVANKSGESWFDLVRTDLEAEGYACGLSVFPACSVGAPHLRKRLYWVADAPCKQHHGGGNGRARGWVEHSDGCESCGVADTSRTGLEKRSELSRESGEKRGTAARETTIRNSLLPVATEYTGPTNGHWRDADWLFCRDGKWRPVEPGTFPLVNGAPARVGRLRGFGNAIVAEQAKAFVRTHMEVTR